MNPERVRQIDELYRAALEKALDERPSFVKQACGGDDSLRTEVESRLQLVSGATHGLAVQTAAGVFEVGAVIAERFHILREIGHGGMGVVYAAHDGALGRTVALKCSRPGHRQRLPPEVRAAREVSHFNVCKVYDLHSVATAEGELQFLSMEYIEGSTLSGKLHRDGPLPPAEALPIARQICAGLAQAHKQGVVHGDLKTANILLARAADGGIRAVITDFGLAKLEQADDAQVRGGTFDYMAPELLLGGISTIASDIYALGVLFHNLLTGRSPERNALQKSKVAEARARKRATPDDSTVTMVSSAHREEDWRRQVENLPPNWKKVVVRCLALLPEQRFRSGLDVANGLEPRRTIQKAAAVTVLMALAGLSYWQWNVTPTGPPVRLAILPLSADSGLLKTAQGVDSEVADRVAGARRNFSVISPRDAQLYQVDSARKARSILGATHVLETRLNPTAGGIAADASLVEVESGRVLGTLKGTYPANDTAMLAKALVATVSNGFQLKLRLPNETVNNAAFNDYVIAREAIRSEAFEDAIAHLARAAELDPRSALPHATLAQVYILKFNRGQGRELLERAAAEVGKARSINPDSAQVLNADGSVQQENGHYEQAIALFTRATELDPGSADVWRRLATAYEKSGRGDEAETTYRKAVAAQPDGYEVYLAFGNFYFGRGEYPRAEQLFRKVTLLAPENPTGHTDLGLAFAQQGQFPPAEQELQKAVTLRRSATALTNLGAIYYAQEHYDRALEMFSEVVSSNPPTATRYRNLGDAYRHLNRSQPAQAAYRQALGLTEQEVTANPRQGFARARLAYLSAYLGERRTAEFEVSQALALEPGNAAVRREAAKTYEALGERARTIEVLKDSPGSLLEEMNRQPDAKGLRQDPEFQELFQKVVRKQ